MSLHLTVPQVLSWKPDSMAEQATEWDRQATELQTKADERYRAVDASTDIFKGATANAMRDRFIQVYATTRLVVAALQAGRDAAKIASLNLTTARLLVENGKQAVEAKGMTVADDGTCSISDATKLNLLVSVGGDEERYNTAMAALQIDADAETVTMKERLDNAARTDTDTVTAIEKAFATMPAADAFGNTTTPESESTVTAPPVNGTPQQNREWWDSLSADEQAKVVETNPGSVGNLDGLPAAVRDQANKKMIDIERTRLEQEITTLTASAQGNPRDAGAVAGLDEAKGKLDDLNKVDEVLKSNPQAKLLMLDMQSGRQGRAAVAVGDPDTADHISVTTPGLSTNLEESLGSMVGEADTLKAETERQLERAGRSEETVATVAWIGYDPPQKDLTFPTVTVEGRAEEGAPLLAGFYEGLDVAATDNDPHITALGHSYGSLTTSLALQENGNAVDDVVFYGSPGLGSEFSAVGALLPTSSISDMNDAVESPADLGLQDGHVYEMTNDSDWIANLNAFGRSPDEMDWVTHLDTDQIVDDGQVYTEGTEHADYPRKDDTTHQLHRSGYNLAAVVAGLPDNAINPDNR